MSGIPPSEHRPKDLENRYAIYMETIGEKKRDKGEEGAEEAHKSKITHLAVQLLDFMNHSLEFLAKIGDRTSSQGAELKLSSHLRAFKSLLNTLKQEDRSQDAHFLHQLSLAWQEVVKTCALCPTSSPVSIPLRDFTKELQTYPSGEECSFAYYLTEHQKQEWLPLPYITMIQTIHREYSEDPISSALARWTHELDLLLKIVDKRYPL